MKVFGITLLFCSIAAAQHSVEVPLLDCGGMPCIEMSSGAARPLRLILDLGEPNSYLDAKAAHSLDLKPIKSSTDTDINDIQQTVVPGAKIGDLPMGDLPFMVIDTASSPPQLNAKKIPPLPADGVLAFRSFENRTITLDYLNHKVRLSEPLNDAPPCPRSCTPLAIRHVGKYGPVTLTTAGFSINGQTVEAQLDTMFPGTMLIYQDFVKQLGLKKLAKAKQKQFFPYLLGGVELAQAAGATEAYLSNSFADAALYFFDKADEHQDPVNFNATVGSGLFVRGAVTFDFKSKQFWFEPASTTASNPQ